MITVGLIRELYFIYLFSAAKDSEYTLSVSFPNFSLTILIYQKRLKIYYLETLIWSEPLDEEISMFGLESIERIYEIISLIQRGASWSHLKYIFD